MARLTDPLYMLFRPLFLPRRLTQESACKAIRMTADSAPQVKQALLLLSVVRLREPRLLMVRGMPLHTTLTAFSLVSGVGFPARESGVSQLLFMS